MLISKFHHRLLANSILKVVVSEIIHIIGGVVLDDVPTLPRLCGSCIFRIVITTRLICR